MIGAIQAYNEERKIAGAVRSLFEVGCDEVFVLDGAWLLPDGSTFGGGEERSSDCTLGEAEAAGARTAFTGVGFHGDADKQTALIHRSGAAAGDYVVKIDADERIHGRLSAPGSHALVMLHNRGENDLPGIRGTWPRGDDSERPVPLLRVLKYRSDLVCDRPGRWRTSHGYIEPYLVGALAKQLEQRPDDLVAQAHRMIRDHEEIFEPGELAALPILDDVWIEHLRDGAKAEAKRSYYEAVAA